MLGIKSWGDVRAFAYVALPLIASGLAFLATKDQSRAAVWAALAAALAGPVLALIKTPKDGAKARAALYAVIGVVQAVIGVLAATSEWAGTINQYLPMIVGLVGLIAGGTAAANTTTTPDVTPNAQQVIDLAGEKAKSAVVDTLSKLPAGTVPKPVTEAWDRTVDTATAVAGPLLADAVNTAVGVGTSTAADIGYRLTRDRDGYIR